PLSSPGTICCPNSQPRVFWSVPTLRSSVMNRALFALYIAAACALAADGPDGASGVFKSQSVTMNVKSAMAFRAPSFADKGESIIVAVSNVQLNPETIADYSDRR